MDQKVSSNQIAKPSVRSDNLWIVGSKTRDCARMIAVDRSQADLSLLIRPGAHHSPHRVGWRCAPVWYAVGVHYGNTSAAQRYRPLDRRCSATETLGASV